MIRKMVLFIALNFMIVTASANPEGGVVTSGDATITQTPGYTEINQSSSQAILDWRSFNIGANEHTHFQQPTGGVALNRIDPTQGASQIFGQLTATGRIILINQAGIFFGPGAKVDVVGIIASTSDMTNANFLAGKYIFDQPSNYNGAIINQGAIRAAEYGLVGLVGAGVSNEGTITAHLGSVVLASGNKFTVDMYGDQMINFSIDEGTHHQAVDQNGQPLRNAVNNSGTVIADGGRVIMSARAAASVLDNVINMSGIVQAKSVSQKNGVIILDGGNKGIVRVSGKVYASGKAAGQRGGKVKILGEKVGMMDAAHVDVSGDLGGGEILIGGNAHGAGPEQNAVVSYFSPDAILDASAITNGDGGKIVVWADDTTRAYGTILARGGSQGGNGGFVETSGKIYLDVGNINVDLSAPYGLTGSWLLDPTNINIIAGLGTSEGTFSGANPNVFVPSGLVTPATVGAESIANNLATANVTINTTSAVGGDAGNISIQAPITWSTGNELRFIADGSITQEAGSTITNTTLPGALFMTATNGIITLNADINTIGAHNYNNAVTIGTALTLTGTTFAFASTIGLNANLTLANSASSTIGTQISGSNNLTIAGAGTVFLTASNSGYTGTTTINLGSTLQMGIGGTAGSIGFNSSGLVNNGTFIIDKSGGTVNVTTPISGTGDLIVRGRGNVVQLSGANTYTGATILDSSTLLGFAVGDNGNYTSSIADSSGIFVLSGNPVFIAFFHGANAFVKTITGTSTTTLLQTPLDGVLTLTNASGTFAGTLDSRAANAGLTISGGSWTLTNASTTNYSATTTIGSGATLYLSDSGSIVNSNVVNAGTLNISDATSGASIAGLSGAGVVTLGARTLTLSNASGGDYSGIMSGMGGGLILSGGTQILSGVNDYTGATTINGGTLALSGSGKLGDTTTGTTVGASGTLDLQGVTYGAEALTVNGGTISTSTGTSSFAGAITLGATSNINVAGTQLTLSNVISGNTFGITKAGVGKLVLSAINTYTGATTINAGTLALADTGSIATSSGVANAGTFDISSTTSGASIANLTGAGGVILGANKTLTITNASGTFSGAISDAGIGVSASNLTVSGGTQILTGANTYNGTTTINSGATLQLSYSAAQGYGGIINNSSGITNNGTFIIDISANTDRTIAFSVPISGSGDFLYRGNANGSNALVSLYLAAVNTYTGATIVDRDEAFVNSGNVSLQLVGSGAIADSSGVELRGRYTELFLGSTNLASRTFKTITTGIYNSQNTIMLDQGDLILTNASGNYNGGISNSYGSYGITLSSGIWTLGGSQFDQYVGTTTIGAGSTLQLGNGGSTGDIGTGEIVNNGTLTFNRNADFTFSNLISSGTGGVTQAGSGAVTLTAANAYTGTTTINSGTTLKLSGSGSIASSSVANAGTFDIAGVTTSASISGLTGAGNVTLGGKALTINSNVTGIYSGIMSGLGAGSTLTLSGSAALILTNANTYEGVTTIGSGVTLQLGNAGETGSIGAGNIVNNGTLTFNRTNSLTIANAISGTGGLVKNGTGTTTISGTNSYTGGTTIYAGTLSLVSETGLGSPAALNSNLVTVNTGGTLDFSNYNVDFFTIPSSKEIILNGGVLSSTAKYAFLIGAGEIRLSQTSTINATDNGEFSGGFAVYNKIVGTGGLVKTGSGSLYLENSNTYQGATSVNEGYLVLSRSATYVPGGSIGSSAVTIESSGHFGVEYGFNYTDISLSNSISGSGEFYVDGENTVTLTNNNNTFTGVVNVYNGTLNITNAGALGSGQVTVESGAALGLPNTLSAGVNNAIKLNGGALNNTGVNILAGVITLGNGTSSQMVNGGTLMINNAINNAGNLSISGVGDVVLNGIVGGVTPLQSLSISQNATINSGAVTTTGNQSYTSLVALGQNTTFTTGSNGGISLTGGLFDTGAARTLTLVGNSDNTFAFGGTVAGNNTITVNGGTGFNTLDFSLYASPVYMTLASSNDGGVADVGGMTFNNINNSIGTGLNSTLDAINIANAKVYYITPTHGYIADPFYFTNYTVVNARVTAITPDVAETSLAPLQNLNATLTAQTTSYLQFPESATWGDEQNESVTVVNTPTMQYTCKGTSSGGVCTDLFLKSVFNLQVSSNQY